MEIRYGAGLLTTVAFCALAIYNVVPPRSAKGVTVAKSKQIIAGKDPGMYSRIDLGGGRTMVVGPRGYRGYETEDREGRTVGQDNQ